MILNINDDRRHERPDPSLVEAELRRLGLDEFAILSAGEQRYLQTYRNDDGTFTVEYREGSPDAHFGTVAPVAKVDGLVRAFADYLQGGSQWKSLWEWERLELSEEDCLSADNAYLINGEIFRKIACGDETYAGAFDEPACPECDATAGEFHDPGCSLEQCPRCGEANHACNCA